jgi:hypothetical protein
MCARRETGYASIDLEGEGSRGGIVQAAATRAQTVSVYSNRSDVQKRRLPARGWFEGDRAVSAKSCEA